MAKLGKWNAGKLRRLIRKFGESHATFARRLNVKVSTLRDWLYGRNPITGPAVPLLDRLAVEVTRCEPPPASGTELACAR